MAGYLGSLLLAAAFVAVGMFWSAVTRDQIVALLLALVSLVLLFLIGSPQRVEWMTFESLPSWAVDVLLRISPLTYFASISRGVFDLRDVAYFVCFSGFFLYANALVLQHRRLKG